MLHFQKTRSVLSEPVTLVKGDVKLPQLMCKIVKDFFMH